MDKKIYDKSGKWIATETKDWLGNDVIKDRDGKVQNYLGKDAMGNSVVRDRDGKVQSYRGQDMLGNQVMRDRDGKTTGYLGTKDAFGNAVFRDADGKVTGYYGRGGDGTGGFFGTGGSSGYSGNTSYGANSYQDPYDASYQAAMRALRTPVYVSPEEKKLESRQGTLVLLGIIAYLILTAYVVATFFYKALPTNYYMMLGLLTGAMLLSNFLATAGTAFPGILVEILLLAIQSLIYFFQLVTRLDWQSNPIYNLSRGTKGEAYALAFGPAAFLAAILIGSLLGWLYGKRLKERILHPKSRDRS